MCNDICGNVDFTIETKDKKIKKYDIFINIILTVVIIICCFICCCLLRIIDHVKSPNSKVEVFVYAYDSPLLSKDKVEDRYTLRIWKKNCNKETIVNLLGDYKKIVWSDDNNFVIESSNSISDISVYNVDKNSTLFVTKLLNQEFYQYYLNHRSLFNFAVDAFCKVDFEFVEWANESDDLLIRFSLMDTDSVKRIGYLCFSCSLWSISGIIT